MTKQELINYFIKRNSEYTNGVWFWQDAIEHAQQLDAPEPCKFCDPKIGTQVFLSEVNSVTQEYVDVRFFNEDGRTAIEANYGVLINGDMADNWTKEYQIKYCPMCGRKLGVSNE